MTRVFDFCVTFGFCVFRSGGARRSGATQRPNLRKTFSIKCPKSIAGVTLTPSSAPDELYSVLEAFRPFLKSIDMRTVAVRSTSDGEWENLITSLTVSEKTLNEVASVQEKLPKIRNNEVALFLTAAPFDYSPFDYFVQGKIRHQRLFVGGGGIGIGGITIRTRQFDPLKLKVTSSRRRIEGLSKRVLSSANLNSSPEREGLWAIAQSQTGLPKELYYEDMNDLLKSTLRIEEINHAKNFELTISDLAKIENVTFSASSFVVEISKIIGLKNLQLNVLQGRSEKGGNFHTSWRNRYSIDEIEAQQPSETVSVTVQPPDIFPFDSITIELIHRGSFLTIDDTWKRAPLQNVVAPYFKVLDAFCSIDMFKEMLLKPQNFEHAPELMFENAVSWLLSLAGFHTIYLGANTKATKTSFDVLRKYDKYQIGSADIIAYEDNERLLLVDCDIGGLDEQKIQKLVEISEYFKTLCDYGELKIVPVLFTSKSLREDDKKKPVAIVDGNLIERILEDISKGDRESARSRIYICHGRKSKKN